MFDLPFVVLALCVLFSVTGKQVRTVRLWKQYGVGWWRIIVFNQFLFQIGEIILLASFIPITLSLYKLFPFVSLCKSYSRNNAKILQNVEEGVNQPLMRRNETEGEKFTGQ